MKQLLFRLSALVILLGTFSCKNSFDVMKRHYTNGFYVSHSSSKKTKTENTNKKEAIVKKETKPETTQNSETISEVKNDIENNSEIFAEVKKPAQEKEKVVDKNNSKCVNKTIETKTENLTVISKTESDYKNLKGKDLPVKGAMDDDLKFIVCLILCLIPPIACYLWKGKGTWFWVTLVLCLLAFLGLKIAAVFGLYFVSIVIALLVVLDILN